MIITSYGFDSSVVCVFQWSARFHVSCQTFLHLVCWLLNVWTPQLSLSFKDLHDFMCLVKLFFNLYAWLKHLNSFMAVCGWHFVMCRVRPDLLENAFLQPEQTLSIACVSFSLPSKFPWDFLMWTFSPLMFFALYWHILQVFWSSSMVLISVINVSIPSNYLVCSCCLCFGVKLGLIS